MRESFWERQRSLATAGFLAGVTAAIEGLGRWLRRADLRERLRPSVAELRLISRCKGAGRQKLS